LALLAVVGTGCQVITALIDFLPHRVQPPPEHDSALPILVNPKVANCGRVALLPEQPLQGICLAECRYVALMRGRVKGVSYSLRLGQIWHKAVTNEPEGELSTARLLYQVTDDLVVETEKAYWNLYMAWWTVACRSADLDLAITQEELTQRLLEDKQSTRFDLEQARQSRAEANAALVRALDGGTETEEGLCATDRQLRDVLGLPAECALFLPVDCPLLVGPVPSCKELMDQAHLYRLDLQEARADVQNARRHLQRAKDDKQELAERKQLEVAVAREHDFYEKARLELVEARQRVELARQHFALAHERRQAAASLVRAREAAAKEKIGTDRFLLLKAQREQVEAVRAEHTAAGLCALALLELERLSGVLLVRSGIRLPTPSLPNTPRAIAPEGHPVVLPAGLPADRPLYLIPDLLTAYEGPCLLEWLAVLRQAQAQAGAHPTN
jgi:hypothetical protein